MFWNMGKYGWQNDLKDFKGFEKTLLPEKKGFRTFAMRAKKLYEISNLREQSILYGVTELKEVEYSLFPVISTPLMIVKVLVFWDWGVSIIGKFQKNGKGYLQ